MPAPKETRPLSKILASPIYAIVVLRIVHRTFRSVMGTDGDSTRQFGGTTRQRALSGPRNELSANEDGVFWDSYRLLRAQQLFTMLCKRQTHLSLTLGDDFGFSVFYDSSSQPTLPACCNAAFSPAFVTVRNCPFFLVAFMLSPRA
jgi:hypothetical protein